jgi:hypothetical protein
MATYGNQVLKGTTSTTVGVGSIECPGSGMRRFKVVDLIVGSDAASLGTSNFRFELQRSTSAATGTAVTFEPYDPADAAAVTLLKSNLTVQGTNTAGKIPLTIPLNQQATFRWVPQPGREIVVPQTANAGLHINTPVSGNTPSAVGHITIEEQ